MQFVYEHIDTITTVAIIIGAIVIVASVIVGLVVGSNAGNIAGAFLNPLRITTIVGGLVMVGIGVYGKYLDS